MRLIENAVQMNFFSVVSSYAFFDHIMRRINMNVWNTSMYDIREAI